MNPEKIAVLDDTILNIWKNAENFSLNDINRIIQELINVLDEC